MSENLKKTVTFNVDNIEIIMVEKNSSYLDDDTLVNEFNTVNNIETITVEKNSLCSDDDKLINQFNRSGFTTELSNKTNIKKSYVFEDAFVKTKYFWWRF